MPDNGFMLSVYQTMQIDCVFFTGTNRNILANYTNLSFKEIANDLGFESYFYFSRIFKDKTGKSPMEFRKEYLQT